MSLRLSTLLDNLLLPFFNFIRELVISPQTTSRFLYFEGFLAGIRCLLHCAGQGISTLSYNISPHVLGDSIGISNDFYVANSIK